jgi:hypothetical protein
VSNDPCQVEKYPYCVDAACHAYELPWMFNNLVCEAFDASFSRPLNATAAERRLGLGMNSAWEIFEYIYIYLYI